MSRLRRAAYSGQLKYPGGQTEVIDLTGTSILETDGNQPDVGREAGLPDRRADFIAALSRHLRAVLVGLDASAALLTWGTVVLIMSNGSWSTKVPRASITAAAVSAFLLLALSVQRLYRARVCVIRAVEVAGVGRAALLCAAAAVALHQVAGIGPSISETAVGAAGAFLAITCLRGAYSGRLRAWREGGQLCRPVCVLGVNDEAEALVKLFQDQPELGYRVVGVLGDPGEWLSRAICVPVHELEGQIAAAARSLGASGVVIAVSAVPTNELDRVVRELVRSGLHVQISAGLARVGHQRLQVSPLSHQVFYYVEPPNFSRWQFATKRAIDIMVTSVGLVLTAPVFALAALAIKLNDGGSVFYRQLRVGRHGRLFEVLKFRTMVPDASEKLAGLVESNERNGPLFKLSNDPRVTRVGKVLRATSLDELPQLINVLRGQMSLVGPRPALPTEVAQFDDELMERTSMPAGITGLWQVEARDNPSFDAYRRLDLFYVDNWSVMMDLAILVSTAGVVLGRAARGLRTGREDLRAASRHQVPLDEASPIGPPSAGLDASGVYGR
jgi:exopolysaccharide biosynthesis polyprenyl glycosylphosphotransferase